jgi:hypothetical protein
MALVGRSDDGAHRGRVHPAHDRCGPRRPAGVGPRGLGETRAAVPTTTGNRCLRRGHVRLERLQGRVDQGGGPVGALGEHVRQVEDARIERPEDQRNEDGRAQERCQALAPSTLAASFSSSGIIASLDLHQRLAAAVEGRNSSVEREINEILVRPADQVADAQHGKSGAPPLPEWGRVGRSGAGGLRTVGLATYSRGPTRTEERT